MQSEELFVLIAYAESFPMTPVSASPRKLKRQIFKNMIKKTFHYKTATNTVLSAPVAIDYMDLICLCVNCFMVENDK